jgi:hypothetical protein
MNHLAIAMVDTIAFPAQFADKIVPHIPQENNNNLLIEPLNFSMIGFVISWIQTVP